LIPFAECGPDETIGSGRTVFRPA